MKLSQYFVVIMTCVFLFACSSVNPFGKKSNKKPDILIATSASDNAIFYKDGREAFITRCESSDWSKCVMEAGRVCKTNGYEILEKTTGKERSLFFSDKEYMDLYFVCKKPENSAPK